MNISAFMRYEIEEWTHLFQKEPKAVYVYQRYSGTCPIEMLVELSVVLRDIHRDFDFEVEGNVIRGRRYYSIVATAKKRSLIRKLLDFAFQEFPPRKKI